MADDKKNIPEAAPPAEAPAPAVENAVVPEQPAPEPALTDAEAVMLEHEGQAALFEMGEAVPDPADAVTHAEVEEPAAPEVPKAGKEQEQPPTLGKDDPAPAHSGKVVDFAAARDEAAKEEKKAVKQERYTGLVQQIKEKSKERKVLIAEKKELPVYHVKRHKALAVRIAELTEDLEELRSEKALLLQKFEYAEDAGAETFRKDIAIMEAGLKKLEAQEQKYAAELDKTLAEYTDLKAQAADFDPVELYKVRQAIRPTQEKSAEQQLEDAIHEKPSLIMLLSAKQEASRLLGEDAEERQVRQMIMRRRSTEQLKRSQLKKDRRKIER